MSTWLLWALAGCVHINIGGFLFVLFLGFFGVPFEYYMSDLFVHCNLNVMISYKMCFVCREFIFEYPKKCRLYIYFFLFFLKKKDEIHYM